MTVQELSRYLTLRKQIDEDKEIYENMCQKMGPASPSLSGMPHTPGVRDKVGDLAADLADLEPIRNHWKSSDKLCFLIIGVRQKKKAAESAFSY